MQRNVIFVPIVASINLRDLVASGVLHELQKEKDVTIVVLSALPITPGIRALFKGLPVTFEHVPEVEFSSHQTLANIKRLRSFVFALSNKKLKTTRVMVGTFKAGTYGEKRPFVYYFFKFMDAWNIPPMQWLYGKMRWWLMHLEIRLYKKYDTKYQALFDKYKPTLVVSHAPYARAQIPIQRTAIRNNVPVIAVINSWDNITSSGELSMRMDKFIVWSKLMKQEVVEFLGYKPKDIAVVGALQFDHYFHAKHLRSKQAFYKEMGLDPKKKLITYTVSSELLVPHEYKIAELLHTIIQSEPKLKNYQLLVRMYPPNEKLEPYKRLEQKGVRVFYPSNLRVNEERFLPDEQFLKTLIETMKYSEVVVNYPSTIILDAAIYQKPTINIHFDPDNEKEYYKSTERFYEYNHVEYVVDENATVLAHSPDELRASLLTLATKPHLKEKELRRFQEKICGPVDGNVYKRVAQTIVGYIRNYVRH
jgi:hypothetical protein